ncbi:MAG: hypothetical protein DLM65_00995 [Candidatus Aeolococcus gillhamiae]|uniref:Uncharacterized protein n=1 Tax=Candidatus Aeolococcus gillhamiae TaxID=3127015 RepID=A0A2W6B0J8_9BACT|nr:MAG: hypothetical protein DLM65_00995 [Candidatus Dormibacter sp. RRmetagenome_bin12]
MEAARIAHGGAHEHCGQAGRGHGDEGAEEPAELDAGEEARIVSSGCSRTNRAWMRGASRYPSMMWMARLLF